MEPPPPPAVPPPPRQAARIPLLTAVLAAASVMIFVARLTVEDAWSWEALGRWGVVSGIDVYDGAWWSLFASCLIHADLVHLGLNVFWLWYLGSVAERTIGSLRYTALVLGAAFVSSALELALAGAAGIGLSGVVFAIAAFLWCARPRYAAFRATMTVPIALLFVFWGLLGVVLTRLGVVEIANAAHGGGLAFGWAAGKAALPRRRALWATAMAGMLVATLVSLAVAPWSSEWNTLQARRAMDAGDLETLDRHASAAIAIDPEYGHPYELRGWGRCEREQYEAAIEDLTRAIRLETGNYARSLRGYCLRQLERHAEALADQEAALREDPDDVWAREERGWARIGTGDYEGAIDDFTAVIEADPDGRMWYHAGRGQALRLNEEYADAVEDFDASIALDPENGFTLNERGWTLIMLLRYDDALWDFERALRLDPDDATNYGGRGYLRRQAHDLRGAVADQKKALELDPDYAFAHREIAWVRYDEKQWREAIRRCNKALKIDPDEGFALALRGMARAELGDKQSALRDLSAAIDAEPNEFWIYTQLATLQYDADDVAGAVATLERAIAQGYEDAENYDWLAWVYLSTEDPAVMNRARAIDYARKATKLAPEHGEFWSTLAFAEFASGAYPESLAALKRSLMLGAKRDAFEWITLTLEHWDDEETTPDSLAHIRGVVALVTQWSTDETLKREVAEAADLAGLSGR